MITDELKLLITEKAIDSNEEICGFIIEFANGYFELMECKNIHTNKNHNFKIDESEFIQASKKGEVIIYHSHLENEEFSRLDLQLAETLQCDLLLYVVKSNNFYYYNYNTKESKII